VSIILLTTPSTDSASQTELSHSAGAGGAEEPGVRPPEEGRGDRRATWTSDDRPPHDNRSQKSSSSGTATSRDDKQSLQDTVPQQFLLQF
jgi:hypothetical protein